MLEDHKLRQRYFESIKRNVCENSGCSVREDQIHVEALLEKPHIPMLHQYQRSYEYQKKEEEDKDSILLHDHSTLISGLAQAYLSSVRLLLLVDEKHHKDVGRYTEKTHSFFLDETTFQTVLSRIEEKNLNGHDLLLLTLFKLTDRGMKPFRGIKKLFEEVENMQKKLNLRVYDFDRYLAYEPEREIEFVYQIDLFNDAFLFDFSKLVSINRSRQNVRLSESLDTRLPTVLSQ